MNRTHKHKTGLLVVALIAALAAVVLTGGAAAAETTANETVDVTANDSVLVDVEFNSSSTTTATVNITANGATVNSTNLSFDPANFEAGTGIKTAEFELGNDHAALNASASGTGVSQVWLSVDDSGGFLGGGGIGGASEGQLIGFVVVVVGIAVAYQRDLI